MRAREWTENYATSSVLKHMSCSKTRIGRGQILVAKNEKGAGGTTKVAWTPHCNGALRERGHNGVTDWGEL